ncbi:MAG: MFS transporter [Candidatus Dormibacteraeota bacterium]|nr:MFS transporter [Candidatus Dormibacteraeota bacterium]MBV9525349.1 MFS transporter [Candidatus Dormibacteraeota bacterium]
MVKGATLTDRWRTSAFRPVIQQPVLRRLLPAFAVSAVGDGMAMVAVAWLAISIASPSDRAVVVGVSVAAYTLPGAAGAVLLSRPLRTLAGRHLVAADSTLRALALGVIATLFALSLLHPPLYISVLAVSSLLHAWGLSGQYTLIAEHLPPESRTAGNALLSGFGMASFVIGPVLAGLAVALAGPGLPVAVDAASFAVLAVAALTARGAATPAGEASDVRTRTRGFAVIARNRVLLGLLALTVVYYFLYGPVEVALPLYVTGPLHGDAGLLGLFWTVFGIGATTGSLIAGLTRRLPIWPALLAAVVGWGAALLPLGVLTLTVPAMAGFALGGLLYAPYPALSMTLFQRESAAGSLSQVLAARGAITVLATPLGTALGGPLTSWIGAQRTLLVSASATIASGFIATAIVAVRRGRPGVTS